jgi:hypothetical protein
MKKISTGILFLGLALMVSCKGKGGDEGEKKSDTAVAAPAQAPAPAPAPVQTAPTDSLTTGVNTIMKDYPGVTATVKDGVITVTGESTAAKWKMLKMALDALHPKKVDASGLKVK